MKDIKKNDQQKILLVFAFLVVLLIGIVILRNQRSTQLRQQIDQPVSTSDVGQEESMGIMQVNLSETQIQVGDIVTAQVTMQTRDIPLFGSDAILKYDPLYLQVTDEDDFIMGDYFQNYPRRENDSENGMIKVTGFFQGEGDLTDPRELFSVSFRALQEGQTTLAMDFEKGTTNTSTLVEQGTSKNILDEVFNADLTIVK